MLITECGHIRHSFYFYNIDWWHLWRDDNHEEPKHEEEHDDLKRGHITPHPLQATHNHSSKVISLQLRLLPWLPKSGLENFVCFAKNVYGTFVCFPSSRWRTSESFSQSLETLMPNSSKISLVLSSIVAKLQQLTILWNYESNWKVILRNTNTNTEGNNGKHWQIW